MNKRQANFIMQLPDGYEWEFINNGQFVAGYSGSSILVYEIKDDKLIKCEMSFKENNDQKIEPNK